MTSVIALDGVTSFYAGKTQLKYVNICDTKFNYWRDFLSEMAESWKKLKTSNVFSSFIVCQNCLNCWVIIHCLLVSCTKINHSCCALMIWYSLQLTSKQWIITQQFTARADLFLNYSKFLKLRRSIRAQHRKLENLKFENEMSNDKANCHCFNALSVSQWMHSWSAHLFSVCVKMQFSLYWTSLSSVHFSI